MFGETISVQPPMISLTPPKHCVQLEKLWIDEIKTKSALSLPSFKKQVRLTRQLVTAVVHQNSNREK